MSLKSLLIYKTGRVGLTKVKAKEEWHKKLKKAEKTSNSIMYTNEASHS
jgi:hypothetical protein